MKISFVVPVYNKKPKQLIKCLTSLWEQSHKDIQVICVLDGENQELDKVCRAFQVEGRDMEIHTIPHGGAPAARNFGRNRVKGKVVSYWDADCYAEPEMAAVWVKAFNKTNADFVYSGYKWTEAKATPWQGEPFDPWLITKYNSIGPAMFPCRVEKSVEWDESLSGLQDWDYWRRVVEGGAKGFWIRGYGFATDLPDKDSISGQEDKRRERIEAIRSKYKDKDSDVLVHGNVYKDEAVRIAKLLEADYAPHSFYVTKEYKNILSVGFLPHEIEEIQPLVPVDEAKSNRIVYWTGIDAEQVKCGPYASVKEWVEKIQKNIHKNLCTDYQAQKTLGELGIEAESVAFPRDEGEVCTELPKKFKVLVFADGHHLPLLMSVVKAMPDIDFDIVDETRPFFLTDYTVVTQFCPESRLTDGSKKALLNGRYLISNVQAPYAGYVAEIEDLAKYKESIIQKIREAQEVKELNKEAMEFYSEETDREKFKTSMRSLFAPKLEVVS